MNALFLAVIGVAMILGGYLLYSRYLGSRIYKLNASFRTPAHTLEDGVDYAPPTSTCSGCTTSPP